MKEKYLLDLKLLRGDVVLIYLKSGDIVCGAYLGNYDDTKKEFEFENHRSRRIEKIKLHQVKSLIA